MKRRLALQRVALLVGGVVSAPSLLAILNSCKSPSDSAASTFNLAKDHQALLAEIAEVIIPKTDTPGAKDTGTPEIIEILLRDCYSEAQQTHFIAGLKTTEEEAQKLGSSFVSLSEADKLKVVLTMQEKGKAETEERKKKEAEQIETESGLKKENHTKEEAPIPFFSIVKDLTIFGYYSSEHGVTKEYDYVPVPGRFNGCITVGPDTRTYS